LYFKRGKGKTALVKKNTSGSQKDSQRLAVNPKLYIPRHVYELYGTERHSAKTTWRNG